jgi:hypothetical protein
MFLIFPLFLTIATARDFSISGFSSGAFLSSQVQFAYSEEVISAGLVGGGLYYCALGTVVGAQTYCSIDPDGFNVQKVYDYIEAQEEEGTIDSTSYLKDSSVFLFSGTKDDVVLPEVVKMAYEVYKNYMDEDQIVTKFDLNIGHTWSTDGLGGSCDASVGDCNYDVAEKILTLAYGELDPKVDMIESNLKTFNQEDYLDSLTQAGMAETGYVYVPTNCIQDASDCEVHISLHGCSMNYGIIGDRFFKYTGLNEWAEANDIIVIYPQTAKDGPSEDDERGCWDMWGYTGADYALKSGVQTKAIYSMAQDPPGTEGDDDSQVTLLFSIWLALLITI